MMQQKFNILGTMVKGLITTALYICLWAAIIGYPFMLLWNHLMPMIFHLQPIGFWQGWGLLILAGMLFGRRA
jgi:hypothetical protein